MQIVDSQIMQATSTVNRWNIRSKYWRFSVMPLRHVTSRRIKVKKRVFSFSGFGLFRYRKALDPSSPGTPRL